ncbi:MAG: hypothetical protein OSJ83_04950 [Clostridia bacterium]|nr:hypothetical protein [Clostridia bacterium]
MSKKKKIIVLVGMVALLVLTGCLNYFLNRPDSQPAGGDSSVTYSDYFAASRADRDSSRSETVMYYETIIGNEATSAEAKANAEADLAALVAGIDAYKSTRFRRLSCDCRCGKYQYHIEVRRIDGSGSGAGARRGSVRNG